MISLLLIMNIAMGLRPHQEKLLIPQNVFPSPRPDNGLPDVTVYGYLPYWTINVEDVDLSGLTHIAYFSVGLQSDASLSYTSRWTNNASTLVSRAHARGVKVHLTMTSFSDSINTSVLSSASKRATAINNLKSLIDDYGADGVNIDIEGMPSSLRDELNSFIIEMSEHIDEVVVATPAVDWSDAYDYQTLSDYASLFIMGYDYHGNWLNSDGTWSRPGPVDPLYGGNTWGYYALDSTVDDYFYNDVPANKIILGLALYGRRWDTINSDVPGTTADPTCSDSQYTTEESCESAGEIWSNSSSISFGAAASITAQEGFLFDVVARTPYLVYPFEQIWFGDVDTVQERIQFANEQNLQGIGMWALGYEIGLDGFWEMVAEETYIDIPEEEEDTGTPQDTENNHAPIANAGEDRVVTLGTEVHLDGSYSNDPDLDPIFFQWSQSGGTTVELLDPLTATPYFIPSKTGQYSFILTVSDGTESTIDSVTITITNEQNEDERKSASCTSFPVRTVFWPLLMVGILSRRRS